MMKVKDVWLSLFCFFALGASMTSSSKQSSLYLPQLICWMTTGQLRTQAVRLGRRFPRQGPRRRLVNSPGLFLQGRILLPELCPRFGEK